MGIIFQTKSVISNLKTRAMAQEKTIEPEVKSWLLPFKQKETPRNFVGAYRDRLMERLEIYHRLSDEDKIARVDELLSSVWLYAEEMSKCSGHSLSPVETLYGFMGWLTTRSAATVLGSKHDAAPVPVLIERFAKAQDWSLQVRDDWHKHLVRVPETIADVPKD